MDNYNLLSWLIYRYPHFAEHSKAFCCSLIARAKYNTRILRALVGVMFILCATLFLFIAASACQLQIFSGYQGLTLSLLICSIIQQVTKPLDLYIIKSELSALITQQKV
ncbi:hypothetical protein DS2_09737 [Catenovulum agarivorans DS-2]|uniref:Uncharacterized protein n=1 Tax=Catenovulum agarivorans DS-2 TaxID=1328313 RepID=W7QBA8_9ALTE|nr:hypothetical protein [Catenovulum agarivorans]EWH10064.1 hypothetical protein DS2_09737 [Catenovulum agarivorans DS-2]